VWLVAATPAAKAVIERIDVIDRALRDQLRSGISRGERQALARTLLRLQRNLDAVLAGEPAPSTGGEAKVS
jgi:DNA-binding MarR family transcriptional regulator